MKAKVLFVDDEVGILSAIERNLRHLRDEMEVVTVESGKQGLELVESDGPFAVVVVDMNMPEMNGLEVLRILRRKVPDTTRIMLTGNADQQTAIKAVNEGHIFQFLCKPCDFDFIIATVRKGIEQYRLVHAERELLENTLHGAVRLLADILGSKDPEGFGLSLALRDFYAPLAVLWPDLPKWEMEVSAMLSTIGLLAVPETLLGRVSAGEKIDAKERNMLMASQVEGARMLKRIPRLEGVAAIVQGLDVPFLSFEERIKHRGSDIPLSSRVLNVCRDLVELQRSGQSIAKAVGQVQRTCATRDVDLAVCIGKFIQEQSFGSDCLAWSWMSADELREDQIIAQDLTTADGMILLKVGSRLSSFTVQKLRNMYSLNLIKGKIAVFDP
ncbi:MAG: response regulator [Puniceicoccaceae bacterium]|nr:MAG: response regulator [Puniceicoccaceae bacterium]